MKLNFINDIKKSHNSCKKYEGVKRYIETGNVKETKIIDFEEYTYDKKPSRAKICVPVGTVLFAKMQNSIKVLLIDKETEKYIYSTGFYAFKDERILPTFLKYFFLSSYFNHEKDIKCTGETQKAINDEGMKKIIIDVPSLEEQAEIVSKLDLITDVIESEEERIQLYDELVKSKFVEMFGTLESPSKSYEFKPLMELCEKITDGKHGGCKSTSNTDRYFVGAKEIYDDEIHYDTAPEISIDEFEKDYMRCNIEIGDLLIVNTGATIGKSVIASDDRTEKTLLQKSVAMLKTKKDILSPLFLKYCYAINTEMYRVEGGTAQPNLLISTIKATEIYVPSMEEQIQFIAFVETVKESQFSVKKEKLFFEELLNTEMHKCFD